jgi:hypothetical protein
MTGREKRNLVHGGLDRVFDDAVERVFGSRAGPSHSRSQFYRPGPHEGLRKILDQPQFRYRRHEEDDLSWLEQAELGKTHTGVVDR